MTEKEFDRSMDVLVYHLDELSSVLKIHKINAHKDALSLHWILVEVTDKLLSHCLFSMNDLKQRQDYLDAIKDGVVSMREFIINEGL